MKWPQAGSRASRLAAGVDGAPVAGSLDSDTAALVSLAARLRDIEPPVMSAQYSADLRLRLLQAAPDLIGSVDTVAADTPRQPRRMRARTVRLSAATTAVLLTTGTGVGYASTSALPGDPLYPVKRTIEKVQLVAAGSPLDKGYEHLSQARTRLTEVAGLSADESTYTQDLMVETLDDFSASAQAGAQLLLDAYAANERDGTMQALRTFNRASVTMLNDLGPVVADSVQREVVVAAMSVSGIDEVALETCDCEEPALDVPATLLTLAPEVESVPPPDVTVPAPEGMEAPETIAPVTTVPGSIPTEAITPVTPGGSAILPPLETFAPQTDVPPSGADTAPAPDTEAPPYESPSAPTDEPPATEPPATQELPTTQEPPATQEPPTTQEPPGTPTPDTPTPDPPTPDPPTPDPPTPDPPTQNPLTQEPLPTPDPSASQDPPTTPDGSVTPSTNSPTPLTSDPPSTESPQSTPPNLSSSPPPESSAPASPAASTITSWWSSDFPSAGSTRP